MAAAASTQSPMLPYIGLYAEDISVIEDASPMINASDGHVNFSVCFHVHRLASRALVAQSQSVYRVSFITLFPLFSHIMCATDRQEH